ncbi:hypothetical protein P3X46_011091 [Hevea brasiliensis]|uniref:Protein kinase domain-containing protein n=1 Tax=Hevea brasiliensis TaxID=3981 RepID=A0ABQ9MG38_HEVBR|nr:hypothetical protein P3X46_011091 [Hevea brasiliensis]
MEISTEFRTYDIDQQLQNLRGFPEGNRNCYKVGLKKGSKYLIRATFMYGNYDGQNQAPQFDIHLGSSKWDTVETINATMIISKEIIHVTTVNDLLVCLANTGSGTPFISALELRPLKIASYKTESGSLVLFTRLDVGSTTNQTVRNLTGNKLSGSVPTSLIERSKQNLLVLSVGGNPNLCASISCKRDKKNNLVVPVVASVAGVVIVISALAILFCGLKRRKQKEAAKISNTYKSLKSKGRHFTYSEVLKVTNNLERVLGKGGFGTVYHGYLDDDTQVAVKMLSPSSVQGYKQFQAEVKLLLRVHHRNLTTLVGFCDEGTNMGLIYEYMANGDLEKFLSGSNTNVLKWERRLHIVVEAAKGLEYLHNGSKPPIVHRDVKTSNILLNDKFQAKLADFGLSRSFPVEGATHVSTVVAGTPGYLDPEYSVTNRLTEKSDVYSFGVVLLKIITGRPVIAVGAKRSIHVRQWVSSMLANGDVKNVVDPSLGADFNINSVWKAVEIAMACTTPTSTGRPTMHQVVTDLNECLEIEQHIMKVNH